MCSALIVFIKLKDCQTTFIRRFSLANSQILSFFSGCQLWIKDKTKFSEAPIIIFSQPLLFFLLQRLPIYTFARKSFLKLFTTIDFSSFFATSLATSILLSTQRFWNLLIVCLRFSASFSFLFDVLFVFVN